MPDGHQLHIGSIWEERRKAWSNPPFTGNRNSVSGLYGPKGKSKGKDGSVQGASPKGNGKGKSKGKVANKKKGKGKSKGKGKAK